MNFAYKLALKIFLTGITILIIAMLIVYKTNYNNIISNEMEHATIIVDEVSFSVEQVLLEKVKTTSTIAVAPVVMKALENSNAQFSFLSENARSEKIQTQNEKWITCNNHTNSFLQKYLDNSVAQFFRNIQSNTHGEYGEIFLTNKFGALVASTTKLTTYAHGNKYWWKGTYNNGSVFFDDRGYDESVGGYVLGVVVPVKKDGEIIGILKANLNILGSVSEILMSYQKEFEFENKNEHFGEMKLIRSGGLIVFENGLEPLSKRIPIELTELMQTTNENSFIFKQHSKEWIIALSEISVTSNKEGYRFGGSFESIDHKQGNRGESWYVIDFLPKANIVEPVKSTLKMLLYFGLLLSSIIAIIALIIGSATAKPIKELMSQTQKISKGNFDSRVSVKRKDELGLLAASFNEMGEYLQNTTTSISKLKVEINERQKVEESLKESERKIVTLMNNLPGMAYRCINDEHWTMLFVSEGLKKLTGYQSEDILNNNLISYVELIHVDDRPLVRAKVNEALDKKESYNIEYRIFTRNNETKWVWENGEGVCDESGEIIALEGFINDITARKTYETSVKKQQEHIEVINRLLWHDVTNSFSVLHSAIRVFKKSQDMSILEEANKQIRNGVDLIRSMRQLNETMIESTKLEQIEMKPFLQNLIPKYSISILLKGDCLVLADDALTPVIDNLISNAVKHAKATEILITLKQNKHYGIISFGDNGIGIPDDLKNKVFDKSFKFGKTGNTGLGLYIVRKTIERYGGTILIKDNKPQGTIFEIELKTKWDKE
jgi:PAS domain S-box-containing protein